MTVELNLEQIHIELSRLRQEIQTLRTRLDELAPSRRSILHTSHPYIVRSEGVHGGRPYIRGTGVSVQTIIEQIRLGCSPEQIVEDFDGVLTLAQVHDALSYFYEYQAEIEEDIAHNQAALRRGPQIASPR